jgi:hypothetical protein
MVGVCPLSDILKNTAFRKPDQFLSSGTMVGEELASIIEQPRQCNYNYIRLRLGR